MAVFIIDQFDGTGKVSSDQGTGRLPIASNWSIRFDASKAKLFNKRDWIFLWYGEHNTEPDLERVIDHLESDNVKELWGHRGVLIAVKPSERCAYLFNDCYGSFSIFLRSGSCARGPMVSNSLRQFSGNEIDWTSFYQFLSFGYVFSPYTVFKDVARLQANSCIKLVFNDAGAEASVFNLRNFWNPSSTRNRSELDDLIDILKKEAEGFGPTQLMMSGGWDSRLLLAALADCRPELFTHGDTTSREIAIVEDIATASGLALTKRAFQPSDITREVFGAYLLRNESAMFTHWNPAGTRADNRKLILTAGTFGEVLGGHYGTLNMLPGKKKHVSLLMHMLGLGGIADSMLNLHDRPQILHYLKLSNYRVFWFLRQGLKEEICRQDLIGESNHRLKMLFDSYEQEGMEDAQAMFERFYTEHRGGQYINLQLANSARNFQYRNIFTNRDLVSAVAAIPFERRAHNKINKRIIKVLDRKLLNYPMAATLANAGRPLLLQEGSRALRKVIQRNSVLTSFYAKASRYGDRGFGWNDFGDVVGEEWIKNLSPMLSESLWENDGLVRALQSGNTSNRYPMFDMISKAITLNFQIKAD